MEVKSVKEIINILNRDLTLIDVHIHNLHEQELSNIATQPFENWPSTHSTKKSYSEVTANKPYTEIKNYFQLLENLQENDSPVHVPSELPELGMDFRSALGVRSAHVKGERQVTKDISKTHFHNANFNNPDTKN